MKKNEQIYLVATRILSKSCSDYSTRILDEIKNDVINDVNECAHPTNWNEDDVKLAIGRALMKKLNLEV